MRREGNEILFDDEEQRRRFAEAISFVERTDKMIASAMRAALKIEHEATMWWQAANKLCSEGEQPVYSFIDNRLKIETRTTETAFRWQPRSSIMDCLRNAKELAVSESEFELADEIRILMERKR